MGFTYDVTTTVGQVRLFILDNDADDYQFEDAEIAQFLELTKVDSVYSVRLAAVAALRAWASLLTRKSASVRTLTFARDNRSRASELLALADKLEQEEIMTPAAVDAEIAQTDFVAEQIIYNRSLREGE